MFELNPPLYYDRNAVADSLGVSLPQLTYWLWWHPKSKRYKEFEIAKRGGASPRVIRAPIKPIKDLQRGLVKQIAPAYRPSPHTHGFVEGRSPETNAEKHQRRRWTLRIDLSEFFPTIHFGRVYGMFKAFPFDYPDDVAALLAQLCCHENELPQGAPTSPLISNLICRGLDKDIAELARKERCTYSRYADDLCFSTNRTVFPGALATRESGSSAVAGEELRKIIDGHGFDINEAKTRLIFRSQRQRVTGLVVNDGINVSQDYVRSLRNLLHIWCEYGEEAARARFQAFEPARSRAPGKEQPAFKLLVRGRVQYVGSVKGWGNPVYRRLAKELKRADDTFQGPHPIDGGDFRFKLLTEGKTDSQHMHAAQAYFHGRKEFLDLHLTGGPDSDSGGGKNLLKRCEQLAVFPPDAPCLCLFDTDDSNILRDAVDQDGWKIWGRNVVAVALVPPGGAGEKVCIELLHPFDVLIREDDNGRRIHLGVEFDGEYGHNDDGTRVVPYATKKALIQEKVILLPEKRTVGKSKTEFAREIANGLHPYSDIDFEGFRPTFEAIRNAAHGLVEAESD